MTTKSIVAILLLFVLSINITAQPKATLEVPDGENFNFINLPGAGTLFLSSEKKKATIYFVSTDFSKKFKHTITEDFGFGKYFTLHVLPDGKDFYIYFQPTNKKIHLVKASADGVAKFSTLAFKETIDDVYAHGGQLYLFFNPKKNEYFVRKINGGTLRSEGEEKLALPDVDQGVWQYYGKNGDKMIFGGIVEPNKENKLSNTALWLAYLNPEGDLIDENLMEITPKTGMSFVPSYYYRVGGSSGTTYQGPKFQVYQSPYSTDLYIYTYYVRGGGSGLVWNREGVYLAKINPNPNEEKIVYEKYIKYSSGVDKGTFFSPDFAILEGEYPMIVHEEKNKGKYYGVATILDKEGNIVLNELQTDGETSLNAPELFKYGVIPPVIYLSPATYSEYLAEILKYNKIKSMPEFNMVSEKLFTDKKDKKTFGVFKSDGKWVIVEYDRKNSVVNFY